MRSDPPLADALARDTAAQFITAVHPSVIERVDLPARAERCAAPPSRFADGAIGAWLSSKLGGENRTYLHQALALEGIAAGANVVVATGTASGKSLVFMAAALDEVVNGQGRTLVFYPQKALAGDQYAHWQAELRRLGLPTDLVGEINGDVPVAEREHVLDRARIILATPDALHCWMMRMLHVPAVQGFLESLRYIVIDEAHALDGVFGTQFALFFRRLRSARRRLCPQLAEPQVIAATATLYDPIAHMRAITGLGFTLIDEDDNGAPAHAVTILHIDGPEYGPPAEAAAAEILSILAEAMPPDAAAIGFADSRQGVERIVRRIARPDTLPYRSGLNAVDRRGIEKSLRRGELRAVVSTSAFELGIDIPQFAYGLNVGVPSTRKSLRQRKGRIGRSRPGTFVVMAPAAAFAKLGSSLRESLTGPVERSTLYLDNIFIQFEQARCLLRELSSEDEVPILDPQDEWPEGFANVCAMALAGAARPRFLDEVANLGWDNPHHAYLLRSMPTLTFALKHARTGDLIGTIDHEKALRETYPGATYFHLGKAHRVLGWHSSSYEQTIKLQPLKNAEPTQPIIRFQVTASIEPAELIEGHLLTSPAGCLAETQLRVVESVEGYRFGSTALLYRDLSAKDRRLTRKQREIMTSGVLLRIVDPWFAGSGDHQVAARRAVANALETVILREYGVSLGDIRCAHTGIAVYSIAGARKIDDGIAIFDTVAGGLRLSSPVFEDFNQILSRLELGADLAGAEALLSAASIERLKIWRSDLQRCDPGATSAATDTNQILIFAPDSRVSINVRGQSFERLLLEPQLIATGSGEQLMYRYEASPGVQAWVAHDQVQPVGNEWRRATWDPTTNRIDMLELVE